MYSNDGAVLGLTTVAAPTVLGVALFPRFAFYFLGLAFVLLGCLYLVYKRRLAQVKGN